MTCVGEGRANAATRTALLVLGMHRSGTSATAGLLVRLGAQAPASLMRPNSDNPRGFWESDAFCAFHERLLHAGNNRWDSWTRFNPGWADGAIPADLTNEFRALLSQEFGDAPCFVVKDPRMSRFAGFWLRSLEGERIAAAAIIQVRSPLEVARSLESRDGISQEDALLLWLRHMLDAEFETRAVPRTFVRYADILKDWKAAANKIAQHVGVQWSQRTSDDDADIAEFVDRHLRHHSIGIDVLDVVSPLARWVKETCAALDLLLDAGDQRSAEALASLDRVRAELDDATRVFGPLVAEERRRSAILTSEREAFRERAAHMEAAHVPLQQQAARLEASNHLLEQRVVELEAEKQTLGQQLVNIEQRAQDLARELEIARHHIVALLGSVSWRMTAPLRLIGRLLMRNATT